MNSVIVTGLLVVASVTAAAVVITTLLPSINESSQSVVRANREVATRIGTDIEIIAIAPDHSGQNIEAWIKNVGTVPIESFARSDIFLVTPGQSFELMTHDQLAGPGTWREEPAGITLSRSQTIHIEMVLPDGSPLGEGFHLLRVSTPNGVVAEKAFSK